MPAIDIHWVMCVTVWTKLQDKSPLLSGSVIRYCERCKAAVWLPGSHLKRVRQGWKITCEDCAAKDQTPSELVGDPEIVEGLSKLYGQKFTAEELTEIAGKGMTARAVEHFRKRGS